MNREVAVMHFVNDGIGLVCHLWTMVGLPAFGICEVEINYGSFFAVYTQSPCPYTRRFVEPFAVVLNLECVEFPNQRFYGSGCGVPNSV